MTDPWATRLETVTLPAAGFGVRFRDAVLGAVVADGLTVEAVLPGRRVRLEANRSGVFALHRTPPGAAVTVEVTDPRGRYVPFALEVPLPVPGGLVGWAGRPLVPLVPAVSYPVPAGTAVVRADLWNPLTEQPAAWAVLTVTPPDGPPVRGIADRAGRVVVLLPLPEPDPEPRWPLGVGVTLASPGPVPARPELARTLAQTAVAVLWADAARTTPLTTAELIAGREAVLTTTARSALHLTPAP